MTAETILATTIGVRAAPGPMTAGAGQSFTLRDQDPNSKLLLLDFIVDVSVASTFSVRSPRMHDNVRGIQFEIGVLAQPEIKIKGLTQPLFPQDNLQFVAGIGGGAATYDNVALTVFYENLIGATGDLRTWDSIKDRVKNLMVASCAPVVPATSDWSPGVSINSTIDLFKANTDYAILGATSGSGGGMFAVSGPCTGNVLYGHPVNWAERDWDSQWFKSNSIMTGLPLIPVMKSADKAGTFVYLADPNATVASVDIIIAELVS